MVRLFQLAVAALLKVNCPTGWNSVGFCWLTRLQNAEIQGLLDMHFMCASHVSIAFPLSQIQAALSALHSVLLLPAACPWFMSLCAWSKQLQVYGQNHQTLCVTHHVWYAA